MSWGITISDDLVMVVEPSKGEQRSLLHKLIAGIGGPYTCRRICKIETSHYMSREEAITIGNLIAAAPDLLAACETAIAAYDRSYADRMGLWAGADVDAMRTAIAKAKGET